MQLKSTTPSAKGTWEMASHYDTDGKQSMFHLPYGQQENSCPLQLLSAFSPVTPRSWGVAAGHWVNWITPTEFWNLFERLHFFFFPPMKTIEKCWGELIPPPQRTKKSWNLIHNNILNIINTGKVKSCLYVNHLCILLLLFSPFNFTGISFCKQILNENLHCQWRAFARNWFASDIWMIYKHL